MKSELILKAIAALNDARDALFVGKKSIKEQVEIGVRCEDCAIRLRMALKKDMRDNDADDKEMVRYLMEEA